MGHLNGSVIGYMEEHIEQTMMDNFKEKKYLEAKLAYTEEKLKEAKQNADKKSWSENYQAVKWA